MSYHDVARNISWQCDMCEGRALHAGKQASNNYQYARRY